MTILKKDRKQFLVSRRIVPFQLADMAYFFYCFFFFFFCRCLFFFFQQFFLFFHSINSIWLFCSILLNGLKMSDMFDAFFEQEKISLLMLLPLFIEGIAFTLNKKI